MVPASQQPAAAEHVGARRICRFELRAIAVIDTHITTACVTLYLHAVRRISITFNPMVKHFMRFGSAGTAMPTRECAVHRCHH